MLFLLLGPSGVGKGTQINLLKQRHPEYIFPKSITTRKMRPGESQGNPYHFISDEEFDTHISNGDFLEWAQVHQAARYGTLRKPIEEALQENKTVIKELDIQGLIQIQKTLDEGHFDELKKRLRSIFIMPPNEETLIKRITERSEIKERELNARLESARREIEQAKLCSSIISTSEDETIEEVYNKLQSIIEAVN
jgi:guanylate kinase